MSDEPPHRPVTEGEARELRPVVAELLRDAPAKWSVRDPTAMTAGQERALCLLIAAAFVERRFRLRFSMATAKSSIEAVFAATGVGGFMEAIEPAVAKAWGAWQDDWREWASGETRDMMPFAVERLPPDEWRLTAEGKLAQSDIVNGDDGPVDFVLWRGPFDGQRRLTIHRRPVAGHGVLEKLTMHDGAPELPRVAVANWAEGGEALKSTIEAALADSLAAYFEKKADEEAPAKPTDGNGDVERVTDGEHRWAMDNLNENHWLILRVCIANGFIDRASSKTEVVITQHVFGTNGKPAKGECGDLRRYFDVLREHGFLKSERGVGTWVSRKGVELHEKHNAERSQTPRIASHR